MVITLVTGDYGMPLVNVMGKTGRLNSVAQAALMAI